MQWVLNHIQKDQKCWENSNNVGHLAEVIVTALVTVPGVFHARNKG